MNCVSKLSRRRVLRGMMGGGAITVGLPFLDCFLDSNGAAQAATGAPLPVCFGTWFHGCGLNPGRWEPKTVGPNYEFGVELQPLTPFKSKINVYSQMSALLDGRPRGAHTVGPAVILQGTTPPTLEHAFNPEPSLDVLVADVIGKRSRFRSLEVSCTGNPISTHSKRAGSAMNPAEISPLALYRRVFGSEFKDPNAVDFTPDATVMARRSVLSAVSEQTKRLMNHLTNISHRCANSNSSSTWSFKDPPHSPRARYRSARKTLPSAPKWQKCRPIIGCLPGSLPTRWHAIRRGCST